MSQLIKNFDGSSRKPRPLQIECLTWIQDTYALPIVSAQLGTGSGKSAIGVSVLKEYGGIYIVPTNVLMDQLIRDYPGINYLKGMEHYRCSRLPDNPELTCSDAKDIFKDSCDLRCEYQRSVQRCLDGEPTFANPFSYIHVKMRQGFKPPPVLVVDEADVLVNSFMLMSGTTLNKKFGVPTTLTVPDTLSWLEGVVEQLRGQRAGLPETDREARKRISMKLEKVAIIYQGLVTNPQIYEIYTDREAVCIKPIHPPKVIVDRFFSCGKVILMSATMSKFNTEEVVQHTDFDFREFGTPIPSERRGMRLEPSAFKMNWETPPKLIASWIKSKMRKYPDRNTIVHLTYKDVERLKVFFPGCIANTKETKTECIREFKKSGGLFLAAACGTGVDLPGDECRLNLIPRLHKPNLGDVLVKKRKSLTSGEDWYRHQIVDTLIQQIGRSTRGIDDESISVVGDKNLKWLMSTIKQDVNKDFLGAIKWR